MSIFTSSETKTKGFTLIELLVVIAIIGVLSGVLITIINPGTLLAKARDAKRLDILDDLNKAIYIAIVEGEITLTSTTGCGTCTSTTGTQAVDGANGFVKFTIPAGKTGLAKYINVLQLDPTNVNPYAFTYASNGTLYELNAVLESTENAAKMTTDGGNNAAVYEVGTSLTIL